MFFTRKHGWGQRAESNAVGTDSAQSRVLVGNCPKGRERFGLTSVVTSKQHDQSFGNANAALGARARSGLARSLNLPAT